MEIAVVINDREKIIDYLQSVLNPLKVIPPAICASNGITNETVENAPLFNLISDMVSEMENC